MTECELPMWVRSAVVRMRSQVELHGGIQSTLYLFYGDDRWDIIEIPIFEPGDEYQERLEAFLMPRTTSPCVGSVYVNNCQISTYSGLPEGLTSAEVRRLARQKDYRAAEQIDATIILVATSKGCMYTHPNTQELGPGIRTLSYLQMSALHPLSTFTHLTTNLGITFRELEGEHERRR